MEYPWLLTLLCELYEVFKSNIVSVSLTTITKIQRYGLYDRLVFKPASVIVRISLSRIGRHSY
jgi:hypothetical protein